MIKPLGAPVAPVPGHVLVVDDTEVNRILLQEILELDGHRVSIANDGVEALQRVKLSRPDLVLLDVNMPGMDGLEVCRRLRSDPGTTSLPIILVTALAERAHRLEGIAAGANDYLTKPIDRPDLLLRVRNAMRLHELHREMEEQYQRLRELEELRDNLVHMLVHDLRSPLTGITCYLQMVRERIEALGDSQMTGDFEELNSSVHQLCEMVSDVLDVSRFEADAMPVHPEPVDLRTVAADAVASLGPSRRSAVALRSGTAPVQAVVDPVLLRRVIANLVGNALKFSPRDAEVLVVVERGPNGAEIRVSDRGPGIAPEDQERIFEKFGTGDGKGAAGRSSGLGLTFCRLAVEAHRGRIGVESEPGKGSTFRVTLPL